MEINSLQFLNPDSEIDLTHHKVPHWQQAGAMYFITFRLADSVPQHLLVQWKAERDAWLLHHPEPWNAADEMEYHKRFTGAMERWLDLGHGSCILREQGHARIVSEALLHFDGARCCVFAFVVMPNHVHALVTLHPDWSLEKLLHSWKGFTAHEINRSADRHGELWRRSYYDRLVRDQDHFANCIRYIRRNPVKAKLREGEFLLYESSCIRGIP